MPNSSKSKNIHRWRHISLRSFLLITLSAGTYLGVDGPTLWNYWRDFTAAKPPPIAKPMAVIIRSAPFVDPGFDVDQDWRSRGIEEGMRAEELEMRRSLPKIRRTN